MNSLKEYVEKLDDADEGDSAAVYLFGWDFDFY